MLLVPAHLLALTHFSAVMIPPHQQMSQADLPPLPCRQPAPAEPVQRKRQHDRLAASAVVGAVPQRAAQRAQCRRHGRARPRRLRVMHARVFRQHPRRGIRPRRAGQHLPASARRAQDRRPHHRCPREGAALCALHAFLRTPGVYGIGLRATSRGSARRSLCGTLQERARYLEFVRVSAVTRRRCAAASQLSLHSLWGSAQTNPSAGARYQAAVVMLR